MSSFFINKLDKCIIKLKLKNMFHQIISDHKESVKYLKEKALAKYSAALLMPRKAKKKAKKDAEVLYSIACYGENLLTI